MPSEIPHARPEQPLPPAEILRRKVHSFLHQTYPLSTEGEHLKQMLLAAVAKKDQETISKIGAELPTVERPRLHLFRELLLAKEEMPQFLGVNLVNIQVTKGCSHKCNFCSVSADATIEMMPFAGVLKIAQAKANFESTLLQAWDAWVQLVQDKYGLNINPPLETRDGMIWIPAVMYKNIPPDIGDLFATHPLSQLIRADLLYKQAPIGPYLPEYGKNPFFDCDHQITNYYDGDPFDYNSTSMVHEDGSPADYGDVCRALASPFRPIHITNAGWRRGNRVAARAAQKVLELYRENPAYFYYPRISVNKTERRAEQNMDEYLEDMKATIHALQYMRPEVLLIVDHGSDSDREFMVKVINPLREWLAVEGPPAWTSKNPGQVSHLTGRAAEQSFRSADRDTANCMPGYHLWPSGKIAHQDYELEKFDSTHTIKRVVPVGGRPTATGQNIFR